MAAPIWCPSATVPRRPWVCQQGNAKRDEVNVCIGCNQACLDHIFAQKMSSCLVNPRACNETELVYRPTAKRRKFAVVGAGTGIAAATVLGERGHEVHLFEASDKVGGQLNMAATIPARKEEPEMLKYFQRKLGVTGVNVHLNTRVDAATLAAGRFDEVFLATGVTPRDPKIPGQDHPKVLSYVDVLARRPVGQEFAIIGAGGIGFDWQSFW